jgi:hypothetical protein
MFHVEHFALVATQLATYCHRHRELANVATIATNFQKAGSARLNLR